ncbi:MAG: HAMP domain-containing sensor histidine kinase [Sulfurimonas sp.]
MNDLEKKSFYSFVVLYLGSSFIFVLLSGYWYYSAQKNSLESDTYYRLNHLADKYSGMIINAQMKNLRLNLPQENGYEYSLISVKEAGSYKDDYYEKENYKVLVSSAPQEHLGVKFVLVKTRSYFKKLHALKITVLSIMGLSFVGIVFISILLAKLFMKPLRQRVEQIEGFIQDVSHELNTPITALGMSSSRAIKKGVFDKNILTNISISTKQLESIYKSLTYLTFNEQTQESESVSLAPILRQIIRYYGELSDAKLININANISELNFKIVDTRAELLFSNLLSNAIKYSMPETTISITLKKDYFLIKDEGVGIEKEKLEDIFKLYKRSSNIAGGFGVGLSIVKQICDEYGIKVEVNSELGKGSEFRLYFK